LSRLTHQRRLLLEPLSLDESMVQFQAHRLYADMQGKSTRLDPRHTAHGCATHPVFRRCAPD
jgi:hypothetical protein